MNVKAFCHKAVLGCFSVVMGGVAYGHSFHVKNQSERMQGYVVKKAKNKTSTRKRYLLIPNRAPELLGSLWAGRNGFFDHTEVEILAERGDMAVVKLPSDEVELWAQNVHGLFGGCGGFIDVTHEVSNNNVNIKGSRLSPEDLLTREEMVQHFMSEQDRAFQQDIQATASSQTSVQSETVTSPAVQKLIDLIDSQSYWGFLGELSRFSDRSATTQNGKKAAQFLYDKASMLGRELSGLSVRFVTTGGYALQPSVVATYVGTKPELPGVVIGGHMDTFSSQKPGSDDDASGSSVVLESLRSIAAGKKRFERTIHFVWYAAEERGLVGSSYVVQDFMAKKIPVQAAIQFDMTGHKNSPSASDIYLIDDYINPALNTRLESIIRGYFPTYKIAKTRCGYACSDHANWTRNNFPAVFPFESSFEESNQRIHTGNDKMDFLNQDHAIKFARVAAAFLGEVAGVQAE